MHRGNATGTRCSSAFFVSSYPREGRSRSNAAMTSSDVISFACDVALTWIKRFAKFFRIECPSKRGNEPAIYIGHNVTRQPRRHAALLTEILRIHRVNSRNFAAIQDALSSKFISLSYFHESNFLNYARRKKTTLFLKYVQLMLSLII